MCRGASRGQEGASDLLEMNGRRLGQGEAVIVYIYLFNACSVREFPLKYIRSWNTLTKTLVWRVNNNIFDSLGVKGICSPGFSSLTSSLISGIYTAESRDHGMESEFVQCLQNLKLEEEMNQA